MVNVSLVPQFLQDEVLLRLVLLQTNQMTTLYAGLLLIVTHCLLWTVVVAGLCCFFLKKTDTSARVPPTVALKTQHQQVPLWPEDAQDPGQDQGDQEPGDQLPLQDLQQGQVHRMEEGKENNEVAETSF